MEPQETQSPAPGEDADAVDRAVRLGQLLDLYGPLLTERQRQFLTLHCEEDLSFGEIAREYSVSRQAVHDAVKHAEKALESYDTRLGFSPDHLKRRQAAEDTAGHPAGGNPGNAPAEPRRVAGLGPVIESLDGVIDRMQRSGGVIYNADGIARELGVLADRLRSLNAEE